ncbi:alanine racemase [Desulfobacula sp.]|uniref:alanine racemase n=1 Tax=Desulfobacula sp. TaxID=2593537 RepID=UPI002623591B|nr:alanine racemase [Desulfobacula sp.]
MAQLIVDIKKLKHNIQFLVQYCNKLGLKITGILKGPGLDATIIHEMMSNGIDNVGFSNLPMENNYDEIFHKKPVFISLPSIYEISNIIKYFGTSFHSEISVIERINEELITQNRSHNIVLMVDTGDLREGVLPENVVDIVKKIHEIKNFKLNFSGIGSNMGCCAGMLPNEDNLNILNELAVQIEMKLGLEVKTVSIGGSVMLEWLEKNRLPDKINQIRLGEAIFLGNIPTINKKHIDLHDDVLIFKSDVLETNEKKVDSLKICGKDAFGCTPKFAYTGMRKRAIMNFGISDTYPEGLQPLIDGLDIVCVNSNYTIIDFTNSHEQLKPGDFVEFKMNYMSMLQGFISPFTKIVYKQPADSING